MYSARMLALSAYTIRTTIYGNIKELKNAPPPDTFDMFPVTMNDIIAYIEENRTETNNFVFSSTNPGATEYVLGAAERVIMSIETKLNYIKTFHNHLTNPTRKTLSFVRGEMKEINKYAKFGIRISKLLESFEEYSKSNLLHGAFKLFEKDLTGEILEVSFTAKEEALHRAQAAIHDLEYGENFGFLDGNGETTSLYFRLINAVQEKISLLQFINESSRDTELFKYKGTMSELFNLNRLREDVKSNWHATVAGSVKSAILEKQGLAIALNQDKGVFEYFHHILNSFGIPYLDATKISLILQEDMSNRVMLPDSIEPDEKVTELSLSNNTLDRMKGLNIYVAKSLGKTPGKINAHEYNPDADYETSLIRDGILVANKKEIIFEASTNFPRKKVLETIAELYPFADVRIGKNKGACSTMDFDHYSSLVIPDISFVDIRGSIAAGASPLDSLLDEASTIAHEFTHNYAKYTNLMAQDSAAFIAYFLGKFAYSQKSLNVLETYKSPDIKLTDAFSELVDEWVKPFLFELNSIDVPAYTPDFFKNRSSSKLLLMTGLKLIKDGRIDTSAFKEYPLMASNITHDIRLLQTYIKKNDRKNMKKIIDRLYQKMNEKEEIIETATEATSICILEKLVMEKHDANLTAAHNELKLGMIRKGTLAAKYAEIWHDDYTPEEQRESELKKIGLKHQQHIVQDSENVDNLLVAQGAPALDPYSFYENKTNIPDELLLPMNDATYITQAKYRTRIPVMLNILKGFGLKEGFEQIHKVQNWKEVMALARKAVTQGQTI
jgi:hypothetical protein